MGDLSMYLLQPPKSLLLVTKFLIWSMEEAFLV
jgi:hypothetical protein